jgi:hypothetical protein
MMLENASAGGEGLLVRAEPLEWAEEISQRMVDEVRFVDGALLLDTDPAWAGAINMVLVSKGVSVSELRHVRRPQQTDSRPATTLLVWDDLEGSDPKW